MPPILHARRPRRAATILAVVSAILVVAACGTVRPGQSRAGDTVMDSTQLRGHGYATLHDAISSQHPGWLLPRGGPVNGVQPALGVFIEGSTIPMGERYLYELRPIDVHEVRRLTTTESLHTYNWPWGGVVIRIHARRLP